MPETGSSSLKEQLLEWLTFQLSALSQVNPDILAPYVIALLKNKRNSRKEHQEAVAQSLSKYLLDETEPFVTKLFKKVDELESIQRSLQSSTHSKSASSSSSGRRSPSTRQTHPPSSQSPPHTSSSSRSSSPSNRHTNRYQSSSRSSRENRASSPPSSTRRSRSPPPTRRDRGDSPPSSRHRVHERGDRDRKRKERGSGEAKLSPKRKKGFEDQKRRTSMEDGFYPTFERNGDGGFRGGNGGGGDSVLIPAPPQQQQGGYPGHFNSQFLGQDRDFGPLYENPLFYGNHSSPTIMNRPLQTIENQNLCPDFEQGICLRGDSCPLFHTTPVCVSTHSIDQYSGGGDGVAYDPEEMGAPRPPFEREKFAPRGGRGVGRGFGSRGGRGEGFGGYHFDGGRGRSRGGSSHHQFSGGGGEESMEGGGGGGGGGFTPRGGRGSTFRGRGEGRGRGGGGARGPKQREGSTILVTEIPPNLNTASNLVGYFSQFGSIMNIQVNAEANTAVITYKEQEEALKALRSLKAVLDNRFIKIFWKNSPTPLNPAGVNKEEKTGQPSSSDPTSPKNEKEGDENTVVGEDTMKGPLEIKFPSRDQKTTISEVPNKADLKIINKKPKEDLTQMKTDLRKKLLEQQTTILSLLSKPNLSPTMKEELKSQFREVTQKLDQSMKKEITHSETKEERMKALQQQYLQLKQKADNTNFPDHFSRGGKRGGRGRGGRGGRGRGGGGGWGRSFHDNSFGVDSDSKNESGSSTSSGPRSFHVSGIPQSIHNPADLTAYFRDFGTVDSVGILPDECAIITFDSREGAENAMRAPHAFEDKTVVLKWWDPSSATAATSSSSPLPDPQLADEVNGEEERFGEEEEERREEEGDTDRSERSWKR